MDTNNYGNTREILTSEQQQIADDLVSTFGFDYSQISFEGNSPEPIFDYEALNVLRLRLTDIQMTDPEIVERNTILGIVTAKCTAILPDGRSASDLGSAQFATFDTERRQLTQGEVMPDGSEIGSMLQAQNVALSRALRRAIRAVGVNLFKAYQEFKQSGSITLADIDEEFQSPIGKEIHKLAADWGHIKGKEKTQYQEFIERMFGKGKRSTLALNDIEKSQLANIYRNMIRSKEIAETPQQRAA